MGVGHRVPPDAAALLQVGLPILLRQRAQGRLVQRPADGARWRGVVQDSDLGPDPGVASGCKGETGKGRKWGGTTGSNTPTNQVGKREVEAAPSGTA